VSDDTPLSFVEAVRNPEIRNSSSFQGFNVTKELGNSFSGTLASEHQWQFQVGYTAANTTDGNAVEIFSYALNFEDENFEENRYPLNSSDWQVCTTIYPIEFSSDVAGRSGDAGNASCASYIGDACYEAWTEAFLGASISDGTGCRSPPSFSQIDACRDIGEGSGGMYMATQAQVQSLTIATAYTSTASNQTLPTMVRYSANNSYVDTATGMVYASSDDLPFQGLTSGQQFAWVTRTGPADSSALSKNATKLQLLALTLEPNRRRAEELGSFGYSPEVRLVCGRARTLEEGGGETSGASSLGAVTWAWTSVITAVLATWTLM
jgi:hypothetical protein